jgi:chemotaxis protein MotB
VRRLSEPVSMRPWPSFVDALAAMLLVLVFVITLLSIFSGKVLDQMEGQEKAREAQSLLDEDLALAAAAEGVRVQTEGSEIRILLPENVLFASGEAVLTPDGLALVGRLGRQIAATTRGQIAVEGHTDDRPIRGALAERFPTNWELSTSRATSVVRLFADEVGLAPERLSATGFGPTRPVAPNDDEVGRAANRRIEIRVTP